MNLTPEGVQTVENETQQSENSKCKVDDGKGTKEETNEIEQNYVKILNENGYFINNKKLCIMKGKGLPKKIANFIAIVTQKIIYTNGVDVDFKYKIKGRLIENGIELPEIEITKEEYNAFNFIIGSKWDKDAIIYGNNGIHLREIAQIFARKTMEEIKIYNHMGFEKIQNKLCYLYHGGSIGTVADAKADLSADKLEQYCFTNKKFNEQEAIKRSFSILDVAIKNVSIPFLATIYLSPLISILQEEGIYADYILYIMGKSGSRKSTLAALGLSHFGRNFQRNNFPCSLRDTLNTLEKKAFVLADSMNVLDDLAPEFMSKSRIETFEKILGMYGDRAGRGRMQQNGKTLKGAYTARGTCVVTGEFIPNLSLSRLARCIIIQVNQDSIDLNKLTELENNKEQLSYCMMIYINWIINNEKEIIKIARERMKDLQQMQKNEIHGRINETINVMNIGYDIFLKFLEDYKIITKEKKQELTNEAYQILNEISFKQQVEIEQSNPTNMFYDAIETLLDLDKISLLDYKTGNPIKEYTNGKFAGYLDKEKGRYYFIENVIYGEINKLYISNGENFLLKRLELWRYLANEGILNMTDASRKTVLRTDAKTGKKIRVVDIKMKNIDNI